MDTLTFTTEAGESAAPQDLEDRLRVIEEKIRRDAREIVEVLKVDLPAFVKRFVRDRFLAAGDFADRADAAQLKALKADVEETAQRAGREIVPGLEDWSLWLEGPKAAPSAAERRDLAANPEIQARVQKVGEYLQALLVRHRFPTVKDEDFRDAYNLPSWFISGRLVLSLVESYWRNLEEYLALRTAVAAMRERDQRAKRAERWDSV